MAIEEAGERQKEYNLKIEELETHLKDWASQFELIKTEKEVVDLRLQEALH